MKKLALLAAMALVGTAQAGSITFTTTQTSTTVNPTTTNWANTLN